MPVVEAKEIEGSKAGWLSVSDWLPMVRLFVLIVLPQIIELVTQFLSEHPNWTWLELWNFVYAAAVAFGAKWLTDTRKAKVK